MQCGSDEVEALVDFKCHTSASTVPASLQCVFKGGPVQGALPIWFAPVSEAVSACVGVSAGSIFAKLGHLPALKGGQYHINGTLKACLPKAGGSAEDMRKIAIFEFMSNLASAPMEGHVVDYSPAKKGNDSTSLGSLAGTVTAAGYCAKNGNN
jgi:hypothetical protein